MRSSAKISISGLMVLSLAACGGSGSSSPTPQSLTSPNNQQPVTSVQLSGKVTYDRVPHNHNSGLDYANTIKLPARGIIIEAVNAAGEILDTVVSDPDGAYQFTLDPKTTIQIRAKAQLYKDGIAKWDFRVTDNTKGNKLYALDGSLISTGGNAEQTRDLHAPHGWTGQAYTETRSAAPFAIIDNVYSAVQNFTAIDPSINFPPLEFRWSANNRAAIGEKSLGHIGSTAYFPDGDSGAIYVLGEENRDTDEYDPHVIIHEWGHYFEHQLSRTDSIGGLHSLNDRLDARVAFGEGWSNALAAIVTGDPIYRDASGTEQKYGFAYDIENKVISNPGWFNEASIGSIVYDVFDTKNSDDDNVSAGLGPIYSVMTSEAYKSVPVFTTIFSFAEGLRQDGNISDNNINKLLAAQSIFGEGTNGSGESNSGAIRSALPVYKEIVLGGPPVQLCSVDDAGVYNKLGNREFVFFNLKNTENIKIAAIKVSGNEERDPDFNIWQGNQLIEKSASSSKGQEVFQGRFEAGDYVIEIYDFFNINGSSSKRGDGCYSFSIEG